MAEKKHTNQNSFQRATAVILAEEVSVFSFTVRLLSNDIMQQLKGQGSVIIDTVTTVLKQNY
ncbi:hypothetical protein BH10PSE19_BH10PSE19_04540 [soil metagenome]